MFKGPRVGFLLQALALGLCCWILAVPASQAQTGGFPNIFQFLFGQQPKPQAAPAPSAPVRERAAAPKPKKRAQDFVSTSSARTQSAASGVKPTFFVTVLGDSLGILAAQGLTEAFADKPEVQITSLARDLSGLTRDDYYDWPKAARDFLATKPHMDVAVVMLGINDPQPLKTGGETVDLLSDKWKAAYAQRVESLVAPFRDAHVPVLWVGLPPMRDERFNAQITALNEIFRDHAANAGAKYIDIWDAFADENGQYSAFGPDVDGQKAKLRSDPNGIYFTKPGARKLAQFIESEIKRIMDKDKGKPQNGEIASLPPDIEQEADDINEQIRRENGQQPTAPKGAPLVSKPLAGPILTLTAITPSAHGQLIDATAGAQLLQDDQARALRAGDPPQPRAGRADDFTWPPQGLASTP